MKKHLLLACVVSIFCFALTSAQSTKFRSGIFLHHSTGLHIWGPNGSTTSVPLQIAAYNVQKGLTGQNAVSLSETAWPPVADNEWERWHRIFENKATAPEDIRPLMNTNSIVIIKSCFPSSQMTGYGTAADTLTPTLKTTANYKWHWRSILKVMRQRPANFFVIWTNAPLLPIHTNDQQAILADRFCRWAKDTLAKGLDPQFGPFPANVYVFDFFHKLAGANGKLPLAYAAAPDDSHPGPAATLLVAPQFVQEVFNASIIYEGQGTGAPSAPVLISPVAGATGVSTSPTLSWNASVGALTYRLQVSIASDFSSTVFDLSGLAVTARTLSGLTTSKLYYWRLNATNASGTGAWSPSRSFTTLGTGPAAPALVSPANGSTGVPLTTILRWASSTGATSYRLQVSTATDFSSLVVDQGGLPGTAQTVTGLTAGTLYYWRANATNASGTGGWSPVWSFTTVGTGPLAPALVSPANNATGLPLASALTWSSSTGATSYRLQVSVASNFSSTVFDQSSLAGTTQTVSGLASSTLYYWRVNATNTSGTSAWSQVRSFTTTGGAGPAAPVLVSPANTSTGVALTPILRWASSVGATSYRLQVSDASDFSSLVLDQGGLPGTAQTVTALTAGTLYYWRANATNASGTGGWSQVWSFTTVGTGPLAPALVSPANNATGLTLAPTLSWAGSTGATSYRLQVSASSSFSSLVLDQSGISGLTRTLSGLTAGTIYYWRVNATSAAGTGAWSSAWSFTTMGLGPVAPALVSPANNTTGLPLVSILRWASSVGATSYRLQVSIASDFSSTVFDQANLPGTAQTMSSLVNSNTYYWRVNATNASGTGAWSQVWTFTTLGVGPLAPALVSPANGSTGVPVTSILRWASSIGATSYRLQVSISSSFTSTSFDRSNLPGTAQTVTGLAASQVYYWRVNASNALGAGGWSAVWSFTTAGGSLSLGMPTNDVTSASEGESVPSEFSLSQNYPNPFNPSTTIHYSLPSPAHVLLNVYNNAGQLVVTLVDGMMEPGQYNVRWNANVPSGTYIFRLRAGTFLETRKMILLR